MSDQPARRRARIVSDFTDAGTGERFTAGAERMIEGGAFANYEAAGLVTTPAPRAAPKPATKARKRKTAPASAAAPAPSPVPDAAPPASEVSTPAA